MKATGRDDVVEALLHAHTASCVQVEPNAWKVEMANGSAVHGTARLVDGWLALESAPRGAAGRDPWELLRWNATLPGGVKFALRRGDATPHVRAEVPLDADVDVALRVRQSCAGFSAASALLAAAPHVDGHEPFPAGDGDAIDLPRLCADAGWPFVARASGALAVTLETGLEFHQAVLTVDGSALRISVPLTTDGASRPAVCHTAVAALALRASAVVRVARAAAVNTFDWYMVRGKPALFRLLLGSGRKPLGVDLAGEVEAVGRSVTRFKPGDQVFGTGRDKMRAKRGSFAEYVAARGEYDYRHHATRGPAAGANQSAEGSA